MLTVLAGVARDELGCDLEDPARTNKLCLLDPEALKVGCWILGSLDGMPADCEDSVKMARGVRWTLARSESKPDCRRLELGAMNSTMLSSCSSSNSSSGMSSSMALWSSYCSHRCAAHALVVFVGQPGTARFRRPQQTARVVFSYGFWKDVLCTASQEILESRLAPVSRMA